MDHWYYVIVPVVGILVWGFVVIGGGRRWSASKNNTDLKSALADNAATNSALLAKLEAIDTRLGAVEKTLNDIP